MFYSEDNYRHIIERYHSTQARYSDIVIDYSSRNYNETRADEYAKHGFLRRFMTIKRCIEKIFEILPPDQDNRPSTEDLTEAKIYLHAFIMNVFGCLDNLAWVWVYEKGLAHISANRNHVGLKRVNKSVRETFSTEFQNYLMSMEDWFSYLGEFRDSLAHRIPLYIPPSQLNQREASLFEILDQEKSIAFNNHDFELSEQIMNEQSALGTFKPIMTHSLNEGANLVFFHPQMLADFYTIEEICRKLFDELDL